MCGCRIEATFLSIRLSRSTKWKKSPPFPRLSVMFRRHFQKKASKWLCGREEERERSRKIKFSMRFFPSAIPPLSITGFGTSKIPFSFSSSSSWLWWFYATYMYWSKTIWHGRSPSASCSPSGSAQQESERRDSFLPFCWCSKAGSEKKDGISFSVPNPLERSLNGSESPFWM